ncbi:MFS transporter [Rhizobium deserti]|uniref:MFS transporter n=1 Tax=Rhizobium deserti TaxID=2547961 RepID=A0A4R5UIV1_9HYPH|nr:MFS transporter [Rhizobium deserti]TDK36777.1 MFS transporter [Rhizobium deserti]
MTRWKVIALAVFGGIAAAMHIGKVPPAIPLLREEFGMTLVQAGWLMGLASALGAVCGLVIGRLTDYLTHRLAMIIGLALLISGSLMGFSSHTSFLLLASRVLESFGLIMTIVAAPGLISSSCELQDRQLALGIWGLWLPAGVATMMLTSPLLMTTYGWRGSWLLAASISFVPLVLLSLVNIPAPASDIRTTPLLASLSLTASRGSSWIIAGIFLCYSASFMAVFGFLPTLLIEDMQVELNHASMLAALAVLANAVGNVFGGVFARLGVPRWLLVAVPCLMLTLTSFLVFAEALPVGLRYGASVLYAVSGGLLPATIMGAIPVYAPRRDLVGTFSGFVMQGSNIGQCLGPMLLAMVVGAHGWRAAPYYIASMTLLGLLLSLRLRAIEKARLGSQRAAVAP